MSLKDIIDKAAVAGALVRKAAQEINTLNNAWQANTIHLAQLLANHNLSGGAIADNATNQGYVTSLATAVTVPTDAELDAAFGNALTAQDRTNIKTVIRIAAVMRFVLNRASVALPANDV